MHWRAEWRRWATTGVLATCGGPTGPDRQVRVELTPTGRTLGNNLIAALGNFLIADTPAGPCPACGRDGRTSGGTGGLAIGMHLTAPAAALTERAGRPGVPARRWPGRPRSRSKYTRSLSNQSLGLGGVGFPRNWGWG